MTDRFSPEKRSEIMSRIRGKNTKPEIKVRSLLHRMGYRFRLHGKDLPGKPDIVLPKHRKVIFVHGCFWHRHPGCGRATIPATNQEFWSQKFDRTIERDRTNQRALEGKGWKVFVIWECQMKNEDDLLSALTEIMDR